jgi:hypothetical protein
MAHHARSWRSGAKFALGMTVLLMTAMLGACTLPKGGGLTPEPPS